MPALTPRLPLPDWAGTEPADLLVIGGGATGLGIALQAALEGRRVALVEARDFASGTSSRSTKLLHGGVRYLAQGRLGLVREALRERDTVMHLAPHLAQPLAFQVRPHGLLERLRLALGLRFYDWLAGSHGIGRTEHVASGLRYWDGQFEDARLALALARTAALAGARLRNHTRVAGLSPIVEGWQAQLVDELDGTQSTLQARVVVNATGVWVDTLRQAALTHLGAGRRALVRPSQGIHLVVARERLPLEEAVLVPRTGDGRVLFVLPWLGATLIGTTDTPRDAVEVEPRPLRDEVAFLLRETHRALGVKLQPEDVRSMWAGLRPLVEAADGQVGNRSANGGATSAMSREHTVLRDAQGMFTVTGGKWTTYRSMAADVLAHIVTAGDLPCAAGGPADTRAARLVGAPPAGKPLPSLREPPGPHLWGSEAPCLATLPGAGRPLGAGLTEAMVRFAARHEWAVTVEDMLARRWRLLFLDAQAASRLAPEVARLLRDETGLDPRLDEFLSLCERYRLPREWTFEVPGEAGSGRSPTR